MSIMYISSSKSGSCNPPRGCEDFSELWNMILQTFTKMRQTYQFRSVSDENNRHLQEYLQVCLLISQVKGINGMICNMSIVEKNKVDI